MSDVQGVLSLSRVQGDASASVTRMFPITPSNTAWLPRTARGFVVATSGNVAVHLVGEPDDNVTVIIPSCIPTGHPFPYMIDKVLATGTTATGIMGCE